MTESHPQAEAQVRSVQKAYETPNLVEFGPITGLVQGLPSVGSDGGGSVDSAS